MLEGVGCGGQRNILHNEKETIVSREQCGWRSVSLTASEAASTMSAGWGLAVAKAGFLFL